MVQKRNIVLDSRLMIADMMTYIWVILPWVEGYEASKVKWCLFTKKRWIGAFYSMVKGQLGSHVIVKPKIESWRSSDGMMDTKVNAWIWKLVHLNRKHSSLFYILKSLYVIRSQKVKQVAQDSESVLLFWKNHVYLSCKLSFSTPFPSFQLIVEASITAAALFAFYLWKLDILGSLFKLWLKSYSLV